ncbi:MAG: hypothetical protein QME12_04220 [Nanoarchaeota archaeon]|nr:hypothetical protein [Nanoarchaeota archaeon]
MGRHLKLEQMAQDSMDFLIPFFSASYSISIRRPPLRAPVWKKERDFAGQFSPEGRSGLIELNKIHCNIEKGYHGVVAHELGHAATYQHHKAYFYSTGDKEKDFIYDSLGEGIAMEFERTGLEGLLEAEFITRPDFDTEIKSYREEISSSALFKIGYKLVNFIKQKAGIREIICSPEKYFDAVMSKYGKEIKAISCKAK